MSGAGRLIQGMAGQGAVLVPMGGHQMGHQRRQVPTLPAPAPEPAPEPFEPFGERSRPADGLSLGD